MHDLPLPVHMAITTPESEHIDARPARSDPQNTPRRRRLGWVVVWLIVAAIVFVLFCDLCTRLMAKNALHDNIQQLPPQQVGLLFGCSDRTGGRENLFFRYRIDAAISLWEAGKLRRLIVSGDNRRVDYNEPMKMKKALMARGFPESAIVCDFAGRRTLDSVVRAHRVFGESTILCITQRFQNERAICIAHAFDIHATGFNAQDVPQHLALRTRLRELAARVRLWLDLHLFGTQPHFNI